MGKDTFHYIGLLKAPSNLVLNTSNDPWMHNHKTALHSTDQNQFANAVNCGENPSPTIGIPIWQNKKYYWILQEYLKV